MDDLFYAINDMLMRMQETNATLFCKAVNCRTEREFVQTLNEFLDWEDKKLNG